MNHGTESFNVINIKQCKLNVWNQCTLILVTDLNMYEAIETHYIVTTALTESLCPSNMLYSWELAKEQIACFNRHNIIADMVSTPIS
jgi:hypothetical protein